MQARALALREFLQAQRTQNLSPTECGAGVLLVFFETEFRRGRKGISRVSGRARIFWVSCGALRTRWAAVRAFGEILLNECVVPAETSWGERPGVEDLLERAGWRAHWDCSVGAVGLCARRAGGNGEYSSSVQACAEY